MVKDTIKVLKSCCPTCGCAAYDGEPDEPKVVKFIRRLAWAAEVAGVDLQADVTVKDGTFNVKSITVVGQRSSGRSAARRRS